MIPVLGAVTNFDLHVLWAALAGIGMIFTVLTSFECIRDYKNAGLLPDDEAKEGPCIVATQNLRINTIRFMVCLLMFIPGMVYFIPGATASPPSTGPLPPHPNTYLWTLFTCITIILLAATVSALLDRKDRARLFIIFQRQHPTIGYSHHRRGDP